MVIVSKTVMIEGGMRVLPQNFFLVISYKMLAF